MGQIKVPSAPTLYNIQMPQFLGADLTDAPSYVSPYRSPACPNMIRESSGKVRKWIGWHTTEHYDGRINGFHIFSDETGDTLLIHRGTKLYKNGTVIRDGLNDERSSSRQLNKKLVIVDGKKMLVYYKKDDAFVVEPVEDSAYTPMVTISRSPSGGGQTYEAVNLLGNKRTDSFLGEANVKEYQLSATEISGVDKVEKLDSEGNWVAYTGYTVNNTLGKVTFTTAPGVSPVTGRDNVRITYIKNVDGYADRINKCDIIALYGVSGTMDRLFVAGGEEYPNRDYYCQMDDATYWGDLQYSIIGADNSKIMGYSIIGNRLATHIDRSDNDTNIYIRTGSILEDGTASFKIADAYQGTGTISKYAFANLETEPLFLTEHGIYAVTPSDVIGERYAQLRSYYLNGLLLRQDLKNAVACTYDRFYMLSVGGYLFALDGTQAHSEQNEPYSKRQYEGFYRTNVNARAIVNIDDKLIFGTEDGDIREFWDDYTNVNHFNDDGKLINAYWTTPDLTGKFFHYKKRFKTISTLLGSSSRTSVQISAKYDDVDEIVVDYDASRSRYFCFSQMSFSTIGFEGDSSAQIIREKISIKPDNRKAQFVYKNDILNESFALYESIIEYTMSRG